MGSAGQRDRVNWVFSLKESASHVALTCHFSWQDTSFTLSVFLQVQRPVHGIEVCRRGNLHCSIPTAGSFLLLLTDRTVSVDPLFQFVGQSD